MAVHHVEQNSDATRVCRFDESLQVLRPPVGRVRGVYEHTVVSPATQAGEVAHRHNLDRGKDQRREVIQLPDRRKKGTLGCERTDM